MIAIKLYTRCKTGFFSDAHVEVDLTHINQLHPKIIKNTCMAFIFDDDLKKVIKAWGYPSHTVDSTPEVYVGETGRQILWNFYFFKENHENN